MWEKTSDDGSIHDEDNTYSRSTGTNNMGGTIVTTFLATLNGGGATQPLAKTTTRLVRAVRAGL